MSDDVLLGICIGWVVAPMLNGLVEGLATVLEAVGKEKP